MISMPSHAPEGGRTVACSALALLDGICFQFLPLRGALLGAFTYSDSSHPLGEFLWG